MKFNYGNRELIDRQEKKGIRYRMLVCTLIIALVAVMLPKPANARASAVFRDWSAKNAIIAAAISAGALVGTIILIGLLSRDPQPKLASRPKRIDFGNQPVGTSGKKTVDFINKGGDGLVIAGVSLSGDDCFAVSKYPEVPLMLSSKDGVQLVVEFTAKAGVCKGKLEVKTTGGKKGTAKFFLPLEVRGI